MKNFQILTLMMMMFVMVNAVHKDPSKEQLLDDIHECASTLEQLAKESKKNGTKLPLVKNISDSPTCVKGFFCLAEEVLRHVNLSANIELAGNNLIRALHAYNSKAGINNCTLHTNRKHSLLSFLEDIKNCTPIVKTH